MSIKEIKTSKEEDYLNRVHVIAQKTVAISSMKHMLGLTEEQKRVIEQELDHITESCRKLSGIVTKKL